MKSTEAGHVTMNDHVPHDHMTTDLPPTEDHTTKEELNCLPDVCRIPLLESGQETAEIALPSLQEGPTTTLHKEESTESKVENTSDTSHVTNTDQESKPDHVTESLTEKETEKSVIEKPVSDTKTKEKPKKKSKPKKQSPKRAKAAQVPKEALEKSEPFMSSERSHPGMHNEGLQRGMSTEGPHQMGHGMPGSQMPAPPGGQMQGPPESHMQGPPGAGQMPGGHMGAPGMPFQSHDGSQMYPGGEGLAPNMGAPGNDASQWSMPNLPGQGQVQGQHQHQGEGGDFTTDTSQLFASAYQILDGEGSEVGSESSSYNQKSPFHPGMGQYPGSSDGQNVSRSMSGSVSPASASSVSPRPYGHSKVSPTPHQLPHMQHGQKTPASQAGYGAGRGPGAAGQGPFQQRTPPPTYGGPGGMWGSQQQGQGQIPPPNRTAGPNMPSFRQNIPGRPPFPPGSVPTRPDGAGGKTFESSYYNDFLRMRHPNQFTAAQQRGQTRPSMTGPGQAMAPGQNMQNFNMGMQNLPPLTQNLGPAAGAIRQLASRVPTPPYPQNQPPQVGSPLPPYPRVPTPQDGSQQFGQFPRPGMPQDGSASRPPFPMGQQGQPQPAGAAQYPGRLQHPPQVGSPQGNFPRGPTPPVAPMSQAGAMPQGGVAMPQAGAVPQGGVAMSQAGAMPQGGVAMSQAGAMPQGGVTMSQAGPMQQPGQPMQQGVTGPQQFGPQGQFPRPFMQGPNAVPGHWQQGQMGQVQMNQVQMVPGQMNQGQMVQGQMGPGQMNPMSQGQTGMFPPQNPMMSQNQAFQQGQMGQGQMVMPGAPGMTPGQDGLGQMQSNMPAPSGPMSELNDNQTQPLTHKPLSQDTPTPATPKKKRTPSKNRELNQESVKEQEERMLLENPHANVHIGHPKGKKCKHHRNLFTKDKYTVYGCRACNVALCKECHDAYHKELESQQE